jgi:TolB-like protein
MMNKLNKIGLFLSGALLFACAGNLHLHAQQVMTLEGVITHAAKDIESRLSAGAKLAVLNFTSTAEAFSDYVIEELSGELVTNRKVTIIERRSLDLIRKEMNLQLSGDVSDDSAQAIGKQLGAQAIVTGSLTNLGDVYRFRVKVINVETARIEAQFSYNLGNNQQVAFLLSGNQDTPPLLPASPAVPGSSGTVAAAQTNRAYKIGDTGPAGGIVFYDKGNNSGGWRYLEVSPVETERTAAIYLTSRKAVVGGRRVGDGKENTRKFITQYQREGGGINSAAWLCNELTVNGFDDWYLPSLDEALYMYNNLYLQGRGDLKPDGYWTSYVGYENDIWERIFYVDFSDGSERNFSMIWNLPTARCQVRAIRQF